MLGRYLIECICEEYCYIGVCGLSHIYSSYRGIYCIESVLQKNTRE